MNDINARTIITVQDTIKSMREKILDYIIKVASEDISSKAVLQGKMILFNRNEVYHYKITL